MKNQIPLTEGYSLLELVVVLAIAGVLIAVHSGSRSSPRTAADVHRVVAALDECAWRAMRSRQTVHLSCSSDGQSLLWSREAGLPRALVLPPGERLSQCRFSGEGQALRFESTSTVTCYPGGDTSAGTLVISSSQDSCRIIQSRLGAHRVECRNEPE